MFRDPSIIYNRWAFALTSDASLAHLTSPTTTVKNIINFSSFRFLILFKKKMAVAEVAR